MQTILVTGGAGFIGSHTVEQLLSQGKKVRVLDNLSTGKLANLPSSSDLELIEGDVADAALVAKACQGVDGIVHLAAVASVQASVDDPLATHQTNLIGTVNLLESAKTQGIKPFVFASSAATYGDTDTVPTSESIPVAPLTPYGADKLASEHYIQFYARQYGITPSIFRFFNIYGERQDPSSPYSGVISIFTDRLKAKQPLQVFGDGEQTRDFVYVKDLVKCLLNALETPCGVAPVNLGTATQTSLNQMIAILFDLAGYEVEVSYGPARPGDIVHSCAVNQRLRDCLGFVPQTPMQEGLKYLWESLN